MLQFFRRVLRAPAPTVEDADDSDDDDDDGHIDRPVSQAPSLD
jgi:hypothetical protein